MWTHLAAYLTSWTLWRLSPLCHHNPETHNLQIQQPGHMESSLFYFSPGIMC